MQTMFSCCSFDGQRDRAGTLDARISQSHIGAVYDRIAPVYDVWGQRTESRARERALALAEIEDGEQILEVAVGTGLTFYEIVKRNPTGSNTGIDLSPGMLAMARKRMRKLSGANYSLAQGSAFDLNVADESIDLLINSYMFDLIAFEDMSAVIEEFKRVLKKEGRLVLVNMTVEKRLGSRLYEALYRLSPKTMGGCRGVEMTERLRQHGFQIVVRDTVRQMLFPSEVLLARKP